ncbi:MAG TPA: hypothetical protein VGB97_02945 [Candidatus Paceibacterota bacterium]|jgi:hypothetical protein
MNRVLALLLVGAIVASVVVTYRRTIVHGDFTVVNLEGELEEDYVPEVEEEVTEEETDEGLPADEGVTDETL